MTATKEYQKVDSKEFELPKNLHTLTEEQRESALMRWRALIASKDSEANPGHSISLLFDRIARELGPDPNEYKKMIVNEISFKCLCQIANALDLGYVAGYGDQMLTREAGHKNTAYESIINRRLQNGY